MNAAIAAELRGELPIDRRHARALRLATFGCEWIDTAQACRILCCARGTFFASHASWHIASRPASEHAKSARGCGLLLSRSDCERVAAIRARCRVSLSVACRIYSAIKQDGPL